MLPPHQGFIGMRTLFLSNSKGNGRDGGTSRCGKDAERVAKAFGKEPARREAHPAASARRSPPHRWNQGRGLALPPGYLPVASSSPCLAAIARAVLEFRNRTKAVTPGEASFLVTTKILLA